MFSMSRNGRLAMNSEFGEDVAAAYTRVYTLGICGHCLHA